MNLNNNEVRKVINEASTRWLSFGKCLKYLEYWCNRGDSFKSYFLSNFDLDDGPSEKDPDEKSSKEKIANFGKKRVKFI